MENSKFSADQLLQISATELVGFLQMELAQIGYTPLFEALKATDVPVVRLLIRMAIRCKDSAKPFDYNLGYAERKCRIAANAARRRFVRRVYAAAPLFALALIRERYQDYSSVMLAADLKVPKRRKPAREKFVKHISEMGFRISMIRYLTGQLRFKDLDPALYHRYCNKIAGYYNGLKNKLPIVLTVVYQGEVFEYSFRWNETRFRIDAFVALTRTAKSFEELDAAWASYNCCGN